jgi:uncharacterized membrane protein YgcG
MTQTASRQFGRRNLPVVQRLAKTTQTGVARTPYRPHRAFTPGERYFLLACTVALAVLAALWLTGQVGHRQLIDGLHFVAFPVFFLVRGFVWLIFGIGGRPNGTDARRNKNADGSGGGCSWSDGGDSGGGDGGGGD